MSADTNLDWLYHALGWTLAAAGMVVLAWALFWDRSRGRRRCPKCWYSMEGVPGLRCPECGREVQSEGALFKTHRRWWFARGAACSLVGGCILVLIPVFVQGRLVAAIPTPALIAVLEVRGWPRPDHSASTNLAAELMRRRRGRASGWAGEFVMRRMARFWTFNYRPRWPANVPMVVQPATEFWYYDGRVNCVLQARLLNGSNGLGQWVSLDTDVERLNSAYWGDGFCELGPLPEGSKNMTLELRVVNMGRNGLLGTTSAPTWTGIVTWPVTIHGQIDDIMKPIRSTAIDKEIRNGFVTRERSPYGLHNLDDRVTTFGFELDGTARTAGVSTGMTVEFVRGTEVFSSGSVWDADSGFGGLTDPYGRGRLNELSVYDHKEEVAALQTNDPAWFVRIRPNPAMALRAFGSSSYWSGEVIIPANEIRVLPPER